MRFDATEKMNQVQGREDGNPSRVRRGENEENCWGQAGPSCLVVLLLVEGSTEVVLSAIDDVEEAVGVAISLVHLGDAGSWEGE